MSEIDRKATRGRTNFLGRARLLNAAAVIFGLAVPLFTVPAVWAEDKPLGSVTSQDGKVQVEIVTLKRTEGGTVMLRLQVTNDGNETFGITPGNLRLVDIPGRRIYSPGLSSPSCFTPVGQRLTCYAIFGAPPAATKAMTVQFYEKLDVISTVPVSE
jgi:hypothetical protein